MPNADKENATPQLRRGKTVEQIYQKKTALEHILLRPDTYVGSTEHQFQEMYVFDEDRGDIVHRKIDYVPALYKIFDEILVNAADNTMRDSTMNLIDVTIDKNAGSISVMNNGRGVPVVVHKEHKCYVPELIFGHLLTSDNYDDNEKKVTGGRNGYGAKLTNVFSTKFIIETADKSVGKKFSQTYENNMSQKGTPKISSFQGADFTRVTFWPDLKRFGMKKLDDDIVGLMMKRVHDVAGSTAKKVKVQLNGKPLSATDFQSYVQLYVQEKEGLPCLYERCGERWELAFSLSDGMFSQVSFVNNIATVKGGTHVQHVTEQLVEAILRVVKSKNRGGIEIKPAHVKNHLFVFLNALIENPAFDSQTKETLTTKASKFGSTCELPEKLIKQVLKSGVVDLILNWAKAKQQVDIGKSLKSGTKNQTRLLGVPKLEDANDAGGKNSEECTLILTEGDSAKALAVAGLSVVGRDRYGVFPLRGKVLNVRDANFKQITENKEISAILKILGLDIKRQYESAKGLRYGSIMVMTDQDYDGSHIKGLILNLVHYWWPGLLKAPGFLKQFVTPIVKVWKDGKRDSERKDERCFFTMAEYAVWRNRASCKGWKTKYYKGLGTSTAKEAKEYFSDIEHHEIQFKYVGKDDMEAIDLAFNKKRADDRKDWINGYVDGMHVDHSKNELTYYDFVHKELVQFAKYDTHRSVPSVVDGFKPSQRKVLFGAFKKKVKNDIKVAQFVGYISEQAAYHHGEVSLENTIINLAQNFVGSNNVNLLVPSGQFGTRLQGGKDHAASRYIYTRLMPTTRMMFHPDDDQILKYLDDEGQSIEPEWYCPIIPVVLVNGAEGIGTGWSTSVPNYNPRVIIRNIRRMLRGEAMEEMTPWYKNYKGTITKNEKDEGRYDIMGCLEKLSPTTLSITELPVKAWTQNYKEFLEEMMPKDGKKGADDDEGEHTIKDYREYHTENSVHFEITLSEKKMKEVEAIGLEKVFKMRSSIATTNMVLFDAEGKIAKYHCAEDIVKEFCQLRRKVYATRKAHMVAKLTRDQQILSNKARFILMVVKGELELRKRKRADILKDLQKHGFKPMSELDALLTEAGGSSKKPEKVAPAEAEGDADATEETAEKSDYDYLLNMNLWSLTFEKVEELKKQEQIKKEELNVLKKTTVEEIWDRDLDSLVKGLDEIDAMEADEAAAAASASEGRRKKDGTRAAPKRAASKPKLASRSVELDSVLADRKMLKRPLHEQSDVGDEVQKTTWGGALQQRKHGEEPLPEPQAKKRGRAAAGAAGSTSAFSAAPPAAPEPKEPETGGGLLSRLLSKSSGLLSGSSAGGGDGGAGLLTSSLSSYSALSSGDVFGYLDKPSGASDDAGDDFGPPPGLALKDGEGSAVDAAADEPEGRGRGHGRGRGRGRGKKADAAAGKKQRTD